MTYKHGVFPSEVPTSIIPPVKTSAGLPVVFGTAPLHLASEPAGANNPVLCYSYAEAVKAFGYSNDWDKYTLCEFIYSHFSLFNVAPVVLINVLDPAVHKEAVTNKSVNIADGTAIISGEPVLLGTLVVKLVEAGQPLVKGTDYVAGYNDELNVVITPVEGGEITAEKTSLVLSYTKLKPDMVDSDDIVGGIDITTGEPEGLELVARVYPMFQLVPGQVLAPGWSTDPLVAAVLHAKSGSINGVFQATAIADIPTNGDGAATQYTQAPAWKTNNNYIDPQLIVCWPKVALSGKQFHLSTQLAGICCQTDAANDDIPYKSPSNKSLQANMALTADGKKVYLDLIQANYLNGQGIVTALNFIGGWKLWGNRTGAYPSNTDIKDAFIPVRRMFNWIANTLVLTHWQKVDDPTNRRLVDTLVDSANIWFNGLAATGKILGGRVEFLEEENPVTDLLNGVFRLHYYVAPPPPAEDIEEVIEYDVSYFSTLFD
ncbi:phage tail sheath family protein [Sporomusa sphaeroides DSM 2875]|uniref:phage tail sheath family protein n=1 Tax=Sporomusa sphaeroides TaxID=47679 RepID=UPI00202F45C2|nr:phage tail sheath family protein [Sporomusa sphaeroides]MCM0759607.1 phage tail sheath family protein [Sporomusa sphaeroides DSM 2875]